MRSLNASISESSNSRARCRYLASRNGGTLLPPRGVALIDCPCLLELVTQVEMDDP